MRRIEAFGDQDAERVVHRLERDGADLGPDGLGHRIGRDVGLTGDRPQDSQSLRRDLNAALTKECQPGRWPPGDARSKNGVIQILETSSIAIAAVQATLT